MIDKQHPIMTKATLLLLALIGFVAVLMTTKPGIGLYSDSTYYVGLARRLLQGHGYTLLNAYGEIDPVPKYPFVYPTLLAIAGLSRIDVLAGARWLHATILAANILMAGTISYKLSGRSMGAAVLGGTFMLASYDTFSYHTIALSDTPFLLLLLLGFYLLGNYLEKPSWPVLLGSAAAAGLAFGTRYAGAAFVASGFFAILLAEKRSIARRAANAILYASIGLLPMLLWVVRNMGYNRGATGRRFGIHLSLDIEQIKELALAFSAWASNGSRSNWDLYLRGPLIAAAVLTLVLLSMRSCVARKERDTRRLLPLLYIGCYAAVLLCTSLFLQADLFLDSLRILIPIHVFVIFLSVTMGNDLYRRLKTKPARLAFAALCLVAAVLYAKWTTDFIRDNREDGQGYASSTFTEAELVEAVRDLPPSSRFFSNLPWPIGLHCNRSWSLLPTKIDITTLRESDRYLFQLKAFSRALQEGNVFIAYYKQGDDWFRFPSLEEIQALVPLRVLAETEEGTIFTAAGR